MVSSMVLVQMKHFCRRQWWILMFLWMENRSVFCWSNCKWLNMIPAIGCRCSFHLQLMKRARTASNSSCASCVECTSDWKSHSTRRMNGIVWLFRKVFAELVHVHMAQRIVARSDCLCSLARLAHNNRWSGPLNHITVRPQCIHADMPFICALHVILFINKFCAGPLSMFQLGVFLSLPLAAFRFDLFHNFDSR